MFPGKARQSIIYVSVGKHWNVSKIREELRPNGILKKSYADDTRGIKKLFLEMWLNVNKKNRVVIRSARFC